MKISIKKLQIDDLPVIHRWFNMPHVQEFYSLRNWSEEEVLKKLKPYIAGEIPVNPFIVYVDNKPIAYVQYYRVADFPWPNQDLTDSFIQQCAGMDFFIGESEFLRKGYGIKIVNQFLEQMIWPHFTSMMVDPAVENKAAILFYKKLGFKDYKIIQSENALQQKTTLSLMCFSR